MWWNSLSFTLLSDIYSSRDKPAAGQSSPLCLFGLVHGHLHLQISILLQQTGHPLLQKGFLGLGILHTLNASEICPPSFVLDSILLSPQL